MNEVENRSKGEIPKEILETILSFEYLDSPQNELVSGYFNIFNTKSHLKSKNSNVQLKIPKSWRAEESSRPNIIQKFTDDCGYGINTIMLWVKEMPLEKGYEISSMDKIEFFIGPNMKELVPVGHEFISFDKIKIEGSLAGLLEYEGIGERLDFKAKMRSIQFIFLDGRNMYILQCFVNAINIDEDLNSKRNKYMPLFKSIANSIVLINKYK